MSLIPRRFQVHCYTQFLTHQEEQRNLYQTCVYIVSGTQQYSNFSKLRTLAGSESPKRKCFVSAQKYFNHWHKVNLLCLCSGFIGYAPTFYTAIASSPVSDTDDDQLYYTKLFLDPKKRVSSHVTCPVIFLQKLSLCSTILLKFSCNVYKLNRAQMNLHQTLFVLYCFEFWISCCYTDVK